MIKQIGVVMESSPNQILVEIDEHGIFEECKDCLQVGKYIKIADGNNNYVIASILNLKAIHSDVSGEIKLKFLITTQPTGTFFNDGHFERGSMCLPVPMEPAYLLESDELNKIYLANENYKLPFGKLLQNRNINLKINGNNFFSKHIAVVGSTGSGKSCAVTKILHNVIGISDNQNLHKAQQKNSHIIIFDIHSEYEAAFKLPTEQEFTLNVLSVDNLKLPYWLMNAEELESIFIESNEQNSHNQISQFKQAVILNKEEHNPTVKDVTYDTPVFFDIREVYNYISNLNAEVIGKKENENLPKLSDGTLINDRVKYFDKIYEFTETSTAKDSKASKGPLNGDFDRFILRLDTKLADKRLRFLIDPRKENGEVFKTEDFEYIMKQFLGYLNRANVTIIDLSGIPFEVLSITVSLISRLVFDFCFHYSKLQHNKNLLSDVPVTIVCEEAHNYVPHSGGAEYKSSKKSIERIAKEGRKYGLSLMVVSQRPSEVSETIFAQCNNFVSLRLTNNDDQNYIKRLMPDTINSVADILPNLGQGECIIVGDAVLMPTIVKLEKPLPEPKSQSVMFYTEWQNDWKDVTFENVIKRWRKEQ